VYGFQRSISNHFVFVRHSFTTIFVLNAYVDHNVISRSESTSITDEKRYLGQQFHTKDLGVLCYFFRIVVACSSQDIPISKELCYCSAI
jgi:hypothetical protein